MRRLIALLSVAALVMCASAAAADFPLRVVSQTATTITLGWDARANVVNYTFYANGSRVSNSYNGNLTQITFGKVANCTTPCYVVQSLVSDGQGGYPSSTPPPPVDVCPNIPGDQATIPPGMIKDANGNCVTPPPPSGNNLVLPANTTWRCTGRVDYDLVKVNITQQTQRQDAAFFASGCNGRIGRLEIDTWASDGLHVGAFAHDITVGGGYIKVHGRCGSACDRLHADVVQVLGGQRITFSNMLIQLEYAEGTNSALYINCGNNCQDRPTDVVFDHSTFKRSPDRNRTVRIGDSVRSGIRNSTVFWCGTGPNCGGGEAIAFTANGSPAVDPVNENNTLVLSGG